MAPSRPPAPTLLALSAFATLLPLLAIPAPAHALQPIPLDGVRPAAMPGRLVAPRAPLAIHGAPGTTAETLLAVRDAAVAALDTLEHTYRFPLPAPDGTRGGGPELDLYVVPSGPPSDVTVDALEYGALWDRASAFVTVRGDLSGDALRRAVAEGVAHAILLGVDARTPRPWQKALAASLGARAAAVGPDLDAMRLFQRDPGAALVAHRDDASARGAAMLPDFIAARYDTPDLALTRGLVWMPVARTPGDAPCFVDEPDVFDVMERLFRDEPGGLDGVLTEFAVARAFAGTAGDTVPFAGWLDDPSLQPEATRVLAFAALPAWVTPPRMLEETGVAYVIIDTAGARDGGLNLWFHGVPWRRWAVTVVRVDDTGREAGRAPRAPVVRGEWSTTLESLDRTARVLVVINDLGNGHYDPEDYPDRNGFFALNVARR